MISSFKIVFGYVVVFEIYVFARYYYVYIVCIHAVEFYLDFFSSYPVFEISFDFSASFDTSLIIIVFFVFLILLKDSLLRYNCEMQVQYFKGTIIYLTFENASKFLFDSIMYHIFFPIFLDWNTIAFNQVQRFFGSYLQPDSSFFFIYELFQYFSVQPTIVEGKEQSTWNVCLHFLDIDLEYLSNFETHVAW